MVHYDQDHWERLWSRTVEEHANILARRPPNAHFLSTVADLPPGRALDAGCGHGAETIWLAAHGWKVTAVDFSATALAHARSVAASLGETIAQRIDWVEGDLGSWAPAIDRFDLVTCLYVHVAGSVQEMIQRLASGVAPGGTLLLVGHRPFDPVTGAPTPAADQVQISVEAAKAQPDLRHWEFIVAEERQRTVAASGVDAVIQARRRG
ncbi:MAG: class I SAM-dependent methyltransferase [Flavobacteriales bacterium]|nr:class I SAM-dependent methyltransferase [Flavobacteriales bacterium]